jgi:vacuolar-type H+-ATPase subunit E/Vma4
LVLSCDFCSLLAQKYLTIVDSGKGGVLLNLDDKLNNLQTVAIEEARAQGLAIIDDYQEALGKIFEDHQVEALKQSEVRIKAEISNAKHQLNQANTKAKLELKKQEAKVAQELKDKIFEEVTFLLDDFMKSEAYDSFLLAWIEYAKEYAEEGNLTVYINASDFHKIPGLAHLSGVQLIESDREFMGGVRCVLHDKNILIDQSLQTLLAHEYDQFVFATAD